MTTAEILRAAAQRVRQGWMQGAYSNDAGKVCALGAMQSVLEDAIGLNHGVFGFESIPDEHWWPLVEHVNSVLRTQSIAQWNDAHWQTAESVALGLELAASEAEKLDPAAPVVTWTPRDRVLVQS